MIVVRDLSSLDQISNTAIRNLVRHRIDDLGGAAFETAVLGYFLVVESGDTLGALSTQLGFSILCNRFTGARYDQPEFTPSFELVEEFPSCYDMVFVLSDDGFGVELFIPKGADVDADLTAMCRMFAFRSQVEEAP